MNINRNGLTGTTLTRDQILQKLNNKESVMYHGKVTGSRLITPSDEPPSLADMVEDGFVSAEEANTIIAAEEKKLQASRSRLRRLTAPPAPEAPGSKEIK